MIGKISDFIFRECFIHLIMLLTSLLPNSYPSTVIRGKLIGLRLGSCGKRFRMASGVILNKPSRLYVGDDVYIAHNVWINAVGGVKMGNGSIVGPMSVISTSKHKYVDGNFTHIGEFKPIIIGKGVWIASHVVITDGVTIGDGAMVAAGAIVTRDVEPYSMYAGVPAQKIRLLIDS
ncbi:acyltransferase [Phocaeicola sp.]